MKKQRDVTREVVENGYTVLEGAIDESLVEEKRKRVAEIVERARAGGVHPLTEAGYFEPHEVEKGKLNDVFHKHAAFQEIAKHDEIVDAVTSIIGEEVCIALDHVPFKTETGHPEVLWHRDVEKIRSPPRFLNVWVPLSDVSKEDGCLKVLPGTHDEPMGPDDWEDASKRKLAAKHQSDVEHVEMSAGDVFVNFPSLLHGSGMSDSGSPRYAYRALYMSPTLAMDDIDDLDGYHPVMVRGGLPEVEGGE